MEHKEPKKMDRRQIRTKRQIRESFLELIMDKPMDKITIKELAELADIDRKTFYLHYSSIGDVLEEIQNELLKKLKQLIASYDLFQPSFDALHFFRRMNDIIGENSDFYRRLVIADRYSFFYDKLKATMKDDLIEKYHQQLAQSAVSPVKLGLYTEYVTAGIMAIYVEWLKHPEFDLDEVAQAASEIAYGGGRWVLDQIRGPGLGN